MLSSLRRSLAHKVLPVSLPRSAWCNYQLSRNTFSTSCAVLAKKKTKKISAPKSKSISISSFISVANLANQLGVRYNQLSKSLATLGFDDDQLGHDYILDHETAALVAEEFGFTIINDSIEKMDEKYDVQPAPPCEDLAKLKPRPPIVTIMGHVDHGKTTILDFLRKSSIVKGEFGGITQHIGAFSVTTPVSKKNITFLDTPGHAAFLKMRERGASVTDIVILVIAADDSVKPQTIEAIKHCQKSNANVVLAINKCDKPDAKPDKVLQDLTQHGIFAENYGGDIQAVRVSGLSGLNMDKLEEEVVALAEVLDLKAEFNGVPVEGHVIESQVKKGAGNVATVLVTRGSLKNGSIVVAGQTWGRVKSLKNEFNKTVKVATPSMPVEVYGWKQLPEAGDLVIEVPTEAKAKSVIDYRIERSRIQQQLKELDNINKQRILQKQESEREEKMKELLKFGLSPEDLRKKEIELFGDKEDVSDGPIQVPFIVKADVSGSSEAIQESISQIGNEEVMPEVLYEEVGSPTDSDLDRAESAGASVICFNVKVPKDVALKAQNRNIPIYEFTVIYHLIEEVTSILSSKLKPIIETNILGEAEVKAVFSITNPKNKKQFKIAGSKITSGTIERKNSVVVKRDGLVVFKGSLNAIKSGKDDASSMRKGSECGIHFKNWEDFQEGDTIEAYEEVEVPRYL
ncbi:translation initiation factor 2 [Saccharomycopsis crataegensis]|uniref:Translation initiation factor IF-2, mitochondrial n=1 Tax=Saccharomycopsis crataegensis TaxID=43959 RepID=A0AAV5QR67_9ASCO|nr:translation initiation factor 2 [Saccharomycopsis crataegensis]